MQSIVEPSDVIWIYFVTIDLNLGCMINLCKYLFDSCESIFVFVILIYDLLIVTIIVDVLIDWYYAHGCERNY